MALYNHRGTASSTEKLKAQPECALLTSAKFCKRNLIHVRVVTHTSSKTSLFWSEWMNQRVL